jgi:hypothetical protein
MNNVGSKTLSILFSSVLHQPERFYACTQAKTHAHNLFGVDVDSHEQCCAAPLG